MTAAGVVALLDSVNSAANEMPAAFAAVHVGHVVNALAD